VVVFHDWVKENADMEIILKIGSPVFDFAGVRLGAVIPQKPR